MRRRTSENKHGKELQPMDRSDRTTKNSIPDVNHDNYRKLKAQQQKELVHHEKRFESISSSVSSIISLSEWIQTYGVKTDQLLGRKREIFRDQSGVLRYLDNWHAVEGDVVNNEVLTNENDYYNLTGCIKVHIMHLVPNTQGKQATITRNAEGEDSTVDNTKDSTETSTAITDKVSFLNDWKILWLFFADDNEDEVAEQAPLLRLFVEFFFHFRTCQLMTILYIYNIITLTGCVLSFPNALNSILYLYDYITITVWLSTYYGLVYLYRGRISFSENQLHQPHPKNGVKIQRKSGISKRPSTVSSKFITYYSVHWSSTLRQLCSQTFREMKTLWSNRKRSTNTHEATYSSQIEDSRRYSYYELLNISLKFVTRHNGIDPKEINFNRPLYRLTLVFIVTILPLYIFIYSYATSFLGYVIWYCSSSSNVGTEFCYYYLSYIVLSLGTMTRFIMQYTFAASTLVGLVGLAYGGEIAFRLTNSWMNKYSCLRRVNYHHSSLLVTDEKYVENDDNNNEDEVVSLKGEQKEDQQYHLDETISALHHSSRSQRNVVEGEESSSHRSEKVSNPPLVYDYGVSIHSINDLLRRDATEHYFFIKQVLEEAGKIWSVALTALFILAIYMIGAYVSYLLLFGHTAPSGYFLYIQLGILIAVRVLFLVIYPIASICHANNFMYEIKDCFVNSSPEDFTVLGGRDRWIKFIEVCPLVWSYYGIWLTWDRLVGLIWTAIVALSAYFATTIAAFSPR